MQSTVSADEEISSAMDLLTKKVGSLQKEFPDAKMHVATHCSGTVFAKISFRDSLNKKIPRKEILLLTIKKPAEMINSWKEKIQGLEMALRHGFLVVQ